MTLELSTRQFNYHADERMFTAEASDLGGFPMARVFDDACDVGFRLRSELSGRTVTFTFAHEERGVDGDVCWLDYVSYGRGPRFVARVWND